MYNMIICDCGRIHMIESERISKALDNNKDLLAICANCGNGFILGGDRDYDWIDGDPESTIYMMYNKPLSTDKDVIIEADDFKTTKECKGIEEILYTHGVKVPMISGEYADKYFDGIFFDSSCNYDKIYEKDITIKEIINFIDESKTKRQKVDMDRFINETPEDMLDEISNYYIDGFDWSGTKYQKEKKYFISSFEK